MAIIEVDHVTKEFRLGQLQSLKTIALNRMRRLLGKPTEERAAFKALDDVTFSIDEGEVVGIIGHNGAGKSTLLKLLADISPPTRGRVSVRGRVAPLIEVGAGLIGDLSGRENIYLNAAILGMPKREIARKFDEIVAFAELEDFIDTPVKRYSSGMQVRLGFSIATSVDTDILIVDEVLAVGDLAFQKKCFDRMEDLIRRRNKTVLLVTHAIRQVERICDRAILLDHGRILQIDRPVTVCNAFCELMDRKILQERSSQITRGRSEGTGEVDLLEVFLENESGERVDHVEYGGAAIISLVLHVKAPLAMPVIGIGVHTTDMIYLASRDTEDMLIEEGLAPGHVRVRALIRRFPLLPGTYALYAGIAADEARRMVYSGNNLLHFAVTSSGISRAWARDVGFLPLEVEWSTPAVPDTRARLLRTAAVALD